mmetsp:Transcript_23469/g.79901  ORF Transcript_23469/g.79901 Transcript_23469/m.79901 type:complete len:288 (+) Transcript_23469:90-953(+)
MQADSEVCLQGHMFSQDSLVERLRALLYDADLEKTTERQLRHQLEREFACDLGCYAALIRGEVSAFLSSVAQKSSDRRDMERRQAEDHKEAKQRNKNLKEKGSMCVRAFGLAQLSPALSAFMGVEQAGRGEVVKRVWDYIKENGLQNSKDKRKIIVDDTLGTFLKHPVGMLTLGSQLSKNMYPIENTTSTPASTTPTLGKKESKNVTKLTRKKGMLLACQLSPSLATVIGVSSLERCQATRWFWEYVKNKRLKDEQDGRIIHSVCIYRYTLSALTQNRLNFTVHDQK